MRRSASRLGFTLVELLVVVAIIAILIALLLPAVMRLRMLAEEQEDREQMRSIGHAWLAYARAHQGRTYKYKHTDPNDKWIKALYQYGEIQESLVSPADLLRNERLEYMKLYSTRYTSSFVLNPYFSTSIISPTGKELDCKRISDCVSLSRAIAVLPVSEKAPVPGSGYITAQNWLSGPPALAWTRTTSSSGIQPDRFPNSADTVPGRSNYFFADGHVESITADRIKQWIDASQQFLIPEQ